MCIGVGEGTCQESCFKSHMGRQRYATMNNCPLMKQDFSKLVHKLIHYYKFINSTN